MLKISVVIPCFNSVGFIEETIQSILNQDYSDFQCIVVDGGSTDGTISILNKYKSKRFNWVSEDDKGQSDAINKGLKLVDGDIVTYLCSDDVYESDCFRKVSESFERTPNQKWLYGKCRIINEDGKEIRKLITRYKNFWQKHYGYPRLLVMDFIAQPSVFWRTELIGELGLFDINNHLTMDYEYWLRIGVKYIPGFIDSYLARFRLHSTSKSTTSFHAASMEALEIARKYAVSQNKRYLIPLQYLSYLLVISTYSLLKLWSFKEQRR